MHTAAEFEANIRKNWKNGSAYAVYADWLEEQGEIDKSNEYRTAGMALLTGPRYKHIDFDYWIVVPGNNHQHWYFGSTRFVLVNSLSTDPMDSYNRYHNIVNTLEEAEHFRRDGYWELC